MYNKLLERQIKRYLKNQGELSDDLRMLLKAVSQSYDHYESDRSLLERSMDLSSNELTELNKRLREESEHQKFILDKMKELVISLQKIDQEIIDKDTVEDEDLVSIFDKISIE